MLGSFESPLSVCVQSSHTRAQKYEERQKMPIQVQPTREQITICCNQISAKFAAGLLTLVMIAGATASCSRSENIPNDAVPQAEKQFAAPSEPAPGDYTRSHLKGELGEVDISVITPEALARAKASAQRQTVKKLVLDTDFGVNVFGMDGFGPDGAVLVQPKVLLKSSLSGERLQLKKTDHGTLMSSVTIAFVDGMVSELATGNGPEKLPTGLVIRQREALLSDVKKTLGHSPVLMSEVTCPKSLRLVIHGPAKEPNGSFDVALTSGLTNCPLNTFLPAQLELKEDEWNALVSAFIAGTSVWVQADFNLSVPVVVSEADLSLDPRAVHEWLGMQMKSEGRRGLSVTSTQLDQIKKALLEKIEADFSLSFASELFTGFLGEFHRREFVPLIASKCPSDLACFSTVPASSVPIVFSDDEQYKFKVVREEYFGQPIFIQSISEVNDYFSEKQAFSIKSNSANPLEIGRAHV